jgi:hypothetical protein
MSQSNIATLAKLYGYSKASLTAAATLLNKQNPREVSLLA